MENIIITSGRDCSQQEPSLTPPASRCFSRLEAAELEAEGEPDVETLDLEARLAERVIIWSTMG